MSSSADSDIAISAAAVRTLLELPTAEILRVLVGLGQPNESELLRYLLPADRQLLAAHLRKRIIAEAPR
ncbi:MAG: hypothetical protein ING19_02845 [Azospirillum sp.]|nr:hypothetical protein [Azospirillum sp.]